VHTAPRPTCPLPTWPQASAPRPPCQPVRQNRHACLPLPCRPGHRRQLPGSRGRPARRQSRHRTYRYRSLIAALL